MALQMQSHLIGIETPPESTHILVNLRYAGSSGYWDRALADDPVERNLRSALSTQSCDLLERLPIRGEHTRAGFSYVSLEVHPFKLIVIVCGRSIQKLDGSAITLGTVANVSLFLRRDCDSSAPVTLTGYVEYGRSYET